MPKRSAGTADFTQEVFEVTNEFTALIERDGEWYIAYCPEISGANGQGKSKDEARENLAEAIALILEDRLLPLPLRIVLCRM